MNIEKGSFESRLKDLVHVSSSAFPAVEIEPACTPQGQKVNIAQGHIKVNTSVTCQCRLSEPGYPPGWVRWVTSRMTSQPDVASMTQDEDRDKDEILLNAEDVGECLC